MFYVVLHNKRVFECRSKVGVPSLCYGREGKGHWSLRLLHASYIYLCTVVEVSQEVVFVSKGNFMKCTMRGNNTHGNQAYCLCEL